MFPTPMTFVLLAAAFCVLCVPGLAVAVHIEHARRDLLCLATLTVIAGLAVQAVAFFLLRLVPIGLLGFSAVVVLLSAALLALSWREVRGSVIAAAATRVRGPVLLALTALAVLRYVPFFAAPVAPGADMSMHSSMTALILHADGVPVSYRPLLPIDDFGSNGAGFPALAALLARLTGVPAVTAASFLGCLSHLLLTLAVYAWLRRCCGETASLVAAVLVTAACRDPQLFFLWGGNPTVLSLVFMVGALPFLEGFGLPGATRNVAPAALLLAAAVLTHAVIPYALAFVLPVVRLLRLRKEWQAEIGRLMAHGVMLAAATGFLLLPYLLRWHPALSPAELAWIRHWQSLPVHVPPGHGLLVFPGLLIYVTARLGPFVVFWAGVALLSRLWLHLGMPWEDILFAMLALLLILNASVWLLPASYALYPDRVAVLLILPMASVIAEAGEALLVRSRGSPPPGTAGSRLAVRPWILTCALLLSVPLPLGYWYLWGVRHVSVTRDDLAAIRWIAVNTPSTAVVGTNYGDAGIWIPPLIFRPVTTAHVHVLYLDQFEAWQKSARPAYVFVGEKRVYEGNGYSLGALLRQPSRYQMIFRQGGAAVFRVVEDQRPRGAATRHGNG